MGKMTPKSPAPSRAREVIRRLKRTYLRAETALGFDNPLELLVAVILSAQCTDRKVNEVTSSLFRKYHSVEDYAFASLTELERDIHSTGFYRAKAKNIVAAASMLLSDFNGEIPRTMKELTMLPGVGRKTANIVLCHGFGVVEGIAVDTHVFRVSHRLGLVGSDAKNPVRVESELMEVVPRRDWMRFSDMVILHGREVCGAKKVLCEKCELSDICSSAGKL